MALNRTPVKQHLKWDNLMKVFWPLLLVLILMYIKSEELSNRENVYVALNKSYHGNTHYHGI